MVARNASAARVVALLSQKAARARPRSPRIWLWPSVAIGAWSWSTPTRSAALRPGSGRGRRRPPSWSRPEAGGIVAALRAIRARGGAGLVVIDSMPSVVSDIGGIARSADFVLIPCRPSILDLCVVGRTVELIKQARVAAAFVLNGVPAGLGVGEASVTVEARRALAGYGLPVMKQAIGQRAVLAHALAAGLPVSEFEPDSRATAEIRALASTLEDRLWQDDPTSVLSI